VARMRDLVHELGDTTASIYFLPTCPAST